MENHMIPITMTKRIWNLVRVIFIMARKGISSNRKLLLDINLLLKKGKIAGKALVSSLIFHHRHNNQYESPTCTISTEGEYEFNCSDTPAHHAMFKYLHHHLPVVGGKNKHRKGNKKSEINHVDAAEWPEFFFDEASYEAVNRVLDTLAISEGAYQYSSPGMRSTRVRQLRVTDSPFPLTNNIEDDRHVDEAAEEFINRFYRQLRQQRLTPAHPN